MCYPRCACKLIPDKPYVLSFDNMKILPLEVGHHVTQCIFEATTGYSSNPNYPWFLFAERIISSQGAKKIIIYRISTSSRPWALQASKELFVYEAFRDRKFSQFFSFRLVYFFRTGVSKCSKFLVDAWFPWGKASAIREMLTIINKSNNQIYVGNEPETSE